MRNRPLRRVAWLMLLALIWTAATAEAITVPVRVTRDARVYASVHSSKVLGTVSGGTLLAMSGYGDGWARVEQGSATGYIKTDYLQVTTIKAYVKANAMTVYASNSTSARKLGTMSFGQSVNVTAIQGSWAQVKLNGMVGYCLYSKLSLSAPATFSIYVYCKYDGVKIYDGAYEGAKVIATLDTNDAVKAVGLSASGDYCRLKSGNTYGYALTRQFSPSKVEKPSSPSKLPSSVAASPTGSAPDSVPSGNGVNTVVDTAQWALGKSYQWGKQGPNTFDCSGLVHYCMQKVGVYTSVSARGVGASTNGTKITTMSSLRKGDIVCFRSDGAEGTVCTHVGIYIGGGQFIHASQSAGKVITSSIHTSYWERVFLWGWRVL